MSFVVSARKYRPQNFDELVGQDHIAQTLRNAIKNDKLAHAFLFAGPRGVGKTTSARILAKVLNCENLQDGFKACNECSSCKSFLENASFNIFELDAASNNSVEHIRALNEQVRFQPQQGSYKIYIIDEVHMLSTAAFNAFLKTLEEPPAYAKFILATTEKHKIIPTILSRCQIFDFRRIKVKDIVKQLKHIARQEKRKVDDEALHLIAQKSDGAMRDALSIYDKVASSVEGEINYKDVAENLNVLDYDYFFKLTDSAVKEDIKAIMLILNDVFQYGFEPEQLSLGMMEHLRQLLLVKDTETANLIETGENLKKRYEAQAELCSSSFLLTALNLLNQVDIEMVRSQNKRLSIEIAFSKIAYLNRIVDKKKLFEELNEPDASENPEPVNIQKGLKQGATEVFDLENEDENKDPEPEKQKEQVVKSTKKVPRKSQKLMSVSSNLGNLLKDLDDETRNGKEEGLELSEANVMKIFTNYRSKAESRALKTALEYTKVIIEKENVLILTPTQIYIDYIRQELPLIEILHGSFPGTDFNIRFEVSEETFPHYTAPKKPRHLTTKEKYDLFNSINPQFENLVNTFKLKINN